MKLLDVLLTALIPTLIIIHLILAPYTKVEESFNIQATHDVLVYGMPTSQINAKLSGSYDHFTFSGPVQRTFIGPMVLAGISQPIVATLGFQHAQLIVRVVLGFFNAGALLVFARNVRQAYGTGTARWYLLLQASQFHVLFYASRTLPNMLAFPLTTLAFAYLLPHPDPKAVAPRIRLGLSLLVFAGVIFRVELAILLGTVSIYLLLVPLASLQQLIRPGLVAFFAALLLSVPIDSYFWQRPMWPELAGFYYNAVQGKSSDWGTSAWHYYFTSALPRLLNPLAFIWALCNPVTASQARAVSIPSLAFIVIYSLQPHKETRFIIYVVPPLTAAAALGLNHVFIRRRKSALYALTSLIMVLSVLATFAASTGMLLLSSLNYPGGEALAHLRSLAQQDVDENGVRAVFAHADVLSCMTGVTLFEIEAGGEMPAHRPLRNNKNDKPVSTSLPAAGASGSGSAVLNSPALTMDRTEDRVTLRDPKFWKRFDYLLMEDPAKARGGEWDTVAVVQGYAGIEVLRPGQKVVSDTRDTEHGERTVGKGALVAKARDIVRRLSGGWWIGPRMEPKVRIMKRRKGTSQATQPAVS